MVEWGVGMQSIEDLEWPLLQSQAETGRYTGRDRKQWELVPDGWPDDMLAALKEKEAELVCDTSDWAERVIALKEENSRLRAVIESARNELNSPERLGLSQSLGPIIYCATPWRGKGDE